MRFALALIGVLCTSGASYAQIWGTVEGTVTEAGTQVPLPGVTIVVNGTNFGTATTADGQYALQLPVGRYALRFSFVGYATRIDSVAVVANVPTTLAVSLTPVTVEMDRVTVTDESLAGAGVQRLDPAQVRNIPTPFKGFQALSALLGVSMTNELSNQYSVRGGGSNENLIYLNGFEVHMPFRPRQGEQEGLGLLNPELADRITLYTGSFPARYGGKISSLLDIHYAPAESLSAAASLSTLDAGVNASATHGRFAWTFGARKARARRFFATQELKGNYQPDYTDAQALVRYNIGERTTLSAIGVWIDHSFALDPRSRRTYYGTVAGDAGTADLRSVWITYDDRSKERDGYGTRIAGLRVQSQHSPRFRSSHDVSVFQSDETEHFELFGSTIIYDVVTTPDGSNAMVPRGNALQEDVADNRVRVTTQTAKGRYAYISSRHAAEVGWSVRRLQFDDQIAEHSIVEGLSPSGDPVRITVEQLEGQSTINERQAGLYIQDVVQVSPRLSMTAGVRADYFSFNREWTWSPRLSMRLAPSEHLTLVGSLGIFHQAPTYRELRGTPHPEITILAALNRQIRSQRSLQAVAGAELFLPQRRMYVRAEGYLKQLTNVISYSLANVRINYSGQNDAEAYVAGLDLQARGEFVPGLESWINYSFMMARERYLPEFTDSGARNWTPRPTDQRHTVALYMQDYIPSDPTWKLHMRALFGSGLPYTPPVPGKRVGSVVTQVPGNRLSARYPAYRRLDFGATKEITLTSVRMELTAELLNIFNITNTVAYSWIPGTSGVWERVPTRLTPRTINIRLRATL